jgi:hypothetical protein
MSNSYTHTCFALRITAREAAIIQQAQAFSLAIREASLREIEQLWNAQTAEFRCTFPATATDPFSGFLSLFDDADHTEFDVDLIFTPNDDHVLLTGTSTEFNPGPVARLFARCITQSLPIGVTWCDDSDKHRPGAFGGGGFHINKKGIHWISPYDVNHAERFEPKFVLSTQDADNGPLFWREGHGFGALERATVLSETQAQAMDMPITLDAPEWLQLPCSN